MRLFLFLFLYCWSFYSGAQFSKSTLFLSGIGSYSTDVGSAHSSNATKDVKNLLMGTKVGYFLINKLIVGVSIDWSWNKTNTTISNSFYYQQTETKTKSITIGPFVRYYIVKGLFSEVSYTMGKSHLEFEAYSEFQGGMSRSNAEDKVKISIFSPGLGYSFIVGSPKNIGIDVGVFYRYQNQAPFTFNGLMINFAISGFVNTKKKHD